MLKVISFLVLILFLSVGVFAQPAVTPPQATPLSVPKKTSIELPQDLSSFRRVRVAILKDCASLDLAIPSSYAVKTIQTKAVLKTGERVDRVRVLPVPNGIALGSTAFKIYGIRLESAGEIIQVNGRKYRHALHILRQANGKLLVVNEVDLEEYLKGVMRWEVSDRWPMEAIKAQAVASRTFALFNALTRSGNDYVLDSSVLSQVYGGASSEKPKTSRAVEDTSGEILLYGGKIFPAYFHSTCGGHTTRADLVWPIEPHPSLRGVPCSFDQNSKHLRWQSRVKWDELAQRLRKSGYLVGEIRSMEIQGLDESGRALAIVLDHSLGRSLFNSNDFRLAAGPDIVRSTRFIIQPESDGVTLTGWGWGHGVGLCQWGAKTMSELGYTYKQILGYYYPGSDVVKVKI